MLAYRVQPSCVPSTSPFRSSRPGSFHIRLKTACSQCNAGGYDTAYPGTPVQTVNYIMPLGWAGTAQIFILLNHLAARVQLYSIPPHHSNQRPYLPVDIHKFTQAGLSRFAYNRCSCHIPQVSYGCRTIGWLPLYKAWMQPHATTRHHVLRSSGEGLFWMPNSLFTAKQHLPRLLR